MKLWDEIKVNTVVDTDGMNAGYTMKTKGDMYYDSPYPGGAEDKQSPEGGVETMNSYAMARRLAVILLQR